MILKILKLLILKMNNESLPLILFNCNTTTITKFLALGGCVTNCYNNTFSYISTGSYFSRPCANVWQYFKLNAHEGVFHSTTEVSELNCKLLLKKKTSLYIPFHKFSAVAKHLIEITLGLA